MVSYIWLFLILIGIGFSALTGNLDTINDSILTNGTKALDLMLSILPIIVLWTGIMKIAEVSGLLRKFAKLMEPILSRLFPSVPKDNPALGFIASNIAANMMGLGSAATPFGLKAMSELQKINDKKDTASVAMITFLVLNTAGVTIVPTTVLALRIATGSENPSEIILPGVIATFCSSIGGLLLDYFIRRRNNK
ncbi:MAG TPA: spore maturation protein [Candidatus Onthocola stercorigallinarum]|jgi:spore maturation protein A|nr:spore maturation protein [Candidatus Onthocola stercorigallinarum]